MVNFRIHRSRFCSLVPEAIQCLAYEQKLHLIAVVRADASIELWNISGTPFVEGVIHNVPHTSVEAVTWCKQRLFSTGLDGYIIEYDVIQLAVKSSVPVVYGPSWALVSNKQQTCLAVGTEDGHISIYIVLKDGGLSLEKTFSKQEDRILSLAWNPAGDILVSGSIDYIKLWKVKTGRCKETIEVGRNTNDTETVVWCVEITSDLIVISGDSLGRTSFWDGKTGTLLNSFTSHKSDVLSLCVEKDENTVYSSGIDPVIMKFSRLLNKEGQRKQWVLSLPRNIHTHDVEDLAITSEYLVSGGIDSQLVFSKYPQNHCVKYFPFQQKSYSHIARNLPCLALQYPSKLEVWILGSTKIKEANHGEKMPLATKPSKLLEVKCKSTERLISSAIAKDSSLLAYSTIEEVKVFDLELIKDAFTAEVQVSLNRKCVLDHPSHLFIFSPVSNKLVLARQGGLVEIVQVNAKDPVTLHTFSLDEEKVARIQHVAVSCDEQFIVVADSTGDIRTYSMDNFQIVSKLPHYQKDLVALAIHPNINNVLLVYNDQKVFEYSLKSLSYTSWSRKLISQDISLDLNPDYPIRGIAFDERNENIFILYNECSIYCIDKTLVLSNEKAAKQLKTNADETAEVNMEPQENEGVKICDRYKYLVDVKNYGEELVVIEVTPESILCKLPSPLEKKMFAT